MIFLLFFAFIIDKTKTDQEYIGKNNNKSPCCPYSNNG